MAYKDIRDQIVTFMKNITGIGQVHPFRRHTTTWEEFYQRHTDDKGKVNNWEVTREGVAEDIRAVQNQTSAEPFFTDIHQIKVLGHLAVSDGVESEETFQDLIDNIIAAFRAESIKSPILNGTVLIPSQLQVPTIGHIMFGSVFVHFTEMTFLATEPLGG